MDTSEFTKQLETIRTEVREISVGVQQTVKKLNADLDAAYSRFYALLEKQAEKEKVA